MNCELIKGCELKKSSIVICQLSIVIFALAYFVCQLSGRWMAVAEAAVRVVGRPWVVALEVLLMAVVVVVEAARWSLMRRAFVSGGSFGQDFVASLRGTALGNSTPGGVGEHVGRASAYGGDLMASGWASLCSSAAQTMAIAFAGVAGAVWLGVVGIGFPKAAIVWGLVAMGIVGVAAAVACLVFRRRIGRVARFVAGRRLGWAYVLSSGAVAVLKVCLFSFQLWVLIVACGGVGTADLYAAVLVYYLCVTLTPRLSIVDVGVKGAWSLAVLGGFAGAEAVSAAVILLWGLNIVLPSVVGYVAFSVKS